MAKTILTGLFGYLLLTGLAIAEDFRPDPDLERWHQLELSKCLETEQDPAFCQCKHERAKPIAYQKYLERFPDLWKVRDLLEQKRKFPDKEIDLSQFSAESDGSSLSAIVIYKEAASQVHDECSPKSQPVDTVAPQETMRLPPNPAVWNNQYPTGYENNAMFMSCVTKPHIYGYYDCKCVADSKMETAQQIAAEQNAAQFSEDKIEAIKKREKKMALWLAETKGLTPEQTDKLFQERIAFALPQKSTPENVPISAIQGTIYRSPKCKSQDKTRATILFNCLYRREPIYYKIQENKGENGCKCVADFYANQWASRTGTNLRWAASAKQAAISACETPG